MVTLTQAGTYVLAFGAALVLTLCLCAWLTPRDWWQVRATVDGEAVEGWASSLWLRRADEGRVTGS